MADLATTTAGSNSITWTYAQSIAKAGAIITAALAPASTAAPANAGQFFAYF